MAKGYKGGRKSARTIGGVAAKPGKRNSSAAPSTKSSIGSYGLKSPVQGKQGGRSGLPKASAPAPGRWGSR